MANLPDLGVSAAINIISALFFLACFAFLSIQPINDRVYNSKWYLMGSRSSPRRSGIRKLVNTEGAAYLKFFTWMVDALKISDDELVKHAGLDSVIFLRIFILGLKLFTPITVLALVVLIPANIFSGTLSSLSRDIVYSDIDKLSISNVAAKSHRFWFHLGMAYLFTIWTCYLLYKEYQAVSSIRLQFLESKSRRVDQFTVVVRNVPSSSGRTISQNVDRFFRQNHPNNYLTHQVVYNGNTFAKLVKKKERMQNWLDYFQLKYERHPEKRPTTKAGALGLYGKKVDAIDYYKEMVAVLEKKVIIERERVLKDPKAILPVAFVSFDSRWGAAVCAQTQQSRNPTLWLTEWAPEPRDVYWQNLPIPFFSLSLRKFFITVAVFALVFCYMIPITFVQSLANLDGLERVAPFLRPVIELPVIKSFLQGFLPGLALKIFLLILPALLLMMSKFEGHLANSVLEREAAAKYYYFMLVNVFLGSIIAGTAFEQLNSFIHESPAQIPRTIGVSIPMKGTFFMTYIMVDGWAGIAAEILRVKPLVIYHLKNMFLVKTERDREEAMDPGSVDFVENLPKLQLYFLLGLVYAVVTPLVLPFILVFFGFAYLVFRHQIINVYNQEYESAAAFWPHVHGRIIASLLISQLLLLGLLSTKRAADSTPLLIFLPFLTLWFHYYCKHRFEPAFRKYPLEEAMTKDLEEREIEPNLNLRAYLADAYLHPIFHLDNDNRGDEDDVEMGDARGDKYQSRLSTPLTSELSSPSPPQYVYHYDLEP